MALLSKQQVTQIIQGAPQGTNPAGIVSALRMQGHQLEGYPQDSSQPIDQSQPEGAQLHDTGSFLGNAANSAGNFFSGIGSAITHPIDTAETLGRGVLGLGEQGANALGANYQDKNTQTAQNIESFFKQRYGSLDAVKKTFNQDPIGFLADASTVLSAGGGALSKIGDIGDVSKLGTAADIAKGADFVVGPTGVAAKVGEVTNPITQAGRALSKAGEITNPLNAVSKPLEMGINWAKTGLANLGPKLEESSLRLTPTQKVNYANKLGDVSDYISREIPLGSPESRFESAAGNIDKFEGQIQDFLKKTAKDVTGSKEELSSLIENIKSKYSGERDALEIDKQLDGFKNLLDAKYSDNPSMLELNKLKRSTYQSAFNQAGTKVSDAVEYDIADTLRKYIEEKTKDLTLGKESIGEFNKRYGTAITAKKLLKIAQGRPQVDFVNRLISGLAGGALGEAFGGPIGGALGGFVGKAASESVPATAIKSAIGKTARIASNAIPKVRVPSAALTGVSRVANAVGKK